MSKSKKEVDSVKATSIAMAVAMIVAGIAGAVAAMPDSGSTLPEPVPVVQTAPMPPTLADLMDDAVSKEPELKERTWQNKLRAFILKLPKAIRSILAVPFQIAGSILIKLINIAFKGVLTPLASRILSWVLVALLTASVIIGALKFLFPDRKLKELITKQNVAWFFAIIIAIPVLMELSPQIWQSIPGHEELAQFIIGALIMAVFLYYLLREKSFVWEQDEPGERIVFER